MNRPVVVLDACVLIPMPLCDTLLRAAEKSLYRFHTSPKILEETHRNLVKLFTRRGELNPEDRASRKIEAMKKAFPGVKKIGRKDIKNVQSLVGKNYQCFLEDGNLQIRTSSEELLVEYNDCLITVNNISCRDFKIFDSCVIEAKKHINIFKILP